jgi:hypothetical protein
MKRVFFSIIILLAVLCACSKVDSTSGASEESISTTSLPLKVTEYIANNFPAESISAAFKVSNGTATYIVSLNTLEQLAFDGNGRFLGNGAYFHPGCDSLGVHSDSTRFDHDSIGGEHGGIGHGGHSGHGHGDHGGPDGFGQGGSGNIPMDSLPASINAYLLANFADYTARHAEIESNCQFDSLYEIMVIKDTLHPVKIFFGLTGNYLMISGRAVYTSAPQVVKDYITANYSGYTIMTRMEVFTMADNTLEYSIFMQLQHARKRVLLNADGTFICEN